MAEIKKIKPSLPKGTRDFLPQEVAKRNYIFDTIKSIFRKYGFQQIDTPAFERLETLTGKYGEEGDRLLFKILNSGDPFKDLSPDERNYIAHRTSEHLKEAIHEMKTPEDYDRTANNLRNIVKSISEKGLRYDLTVPLARYVVQHNGELVFPFKRFHIAPVWRADRPQKGRYQEFYQCDADVIGSTSLFNEVELTQIYRDVFEKLGIKVLIQINHRKALQSIASYFGFSDQLFESFATVIDKLDKIGYEGVAEELNKLDLTHRENPIDTIDSTSLSLFREGFYSGTKCWNDIWDAVQNEFNFHNRSVEGISELRFLTNYCDFKSNIVFNPYLARGLSYYTGIIWEVVLDKTADANANISMGSLGGGGRYDNLTEMFGGRDMSGVGISFGVERIYDVMEELNLFPATLEESTKVLFVHFDEASEAYAFDQLQKVRAHDIASEVYPGKKKLDKQMNYANDKKIPYVVVIGGDEMASGKLTFKNMTSGQQDKLTIDEIIERLK